MTSSEPFSSSSPQVCDCLVVDSGGFIKNAPLRSFAKEEVVTLREVVSEIRDKATKERLQILPYELKLKEPSLEDIQHVTNFSKKTGDFCSLSATDIKVMALTLSMEKLLVGSTDHLNAEPKMRSTVDFYKPGEAKNGEEKAVANLAGFYKPSDFEDTEEDGESAMVTNGNDEHMPDLANSFSEFNFWREPLPDIQVETSVLGKCPLHPQDLPKLDNYFSCRSFVVGHTLSEADYHLAGMLHELQLPEDYFPNLSRWLRHIRSFPSRTHASASFPMENILLLGEANSEEIIENVEALSIANGTDENEEDDSIKVEDGEDSFEEEEEEEYESVEEDNSGDDDEGWITPANLQSKRREMTGDVVDETAPTHVRVACLTTDFAMQNVLRQMGLSVISVDGLLIRECKTWLLRCYACFQTTTLMDKKFCPRCGNKTLKRVSCTLNADGSMHIHISGRRRLTGRGQRFSLPAPKGGKHAVNPVLCEDQGGPQQRQTRLARQKTDALAEDYIAGNSPFVLHDVTSRSAQLGISSKGAKTNLYWMRRNPNEVGRKTGNRKKKSNRA